MREYGWIGFSLSRQLAMDFTFGLADMWFVMYLRQLIKILGMFSVIPLKYNSTLNVINGESKKKTTTKTIRKSISSFDLNSL